ncbi:hypothetical protein PVAP13_6KG412006 [Panicum virgatum]|uniref:Uncharacterized protein n=1 Tax=Panicum virgatum TaxID=38727 RepID=A0A8T0RBL0_PANVG|nr:hypothetical protein PVAP13_6KG412006 [Panicum virgatum]
MTGVSPRVIVAKPRPRRSSSDFKLQDPPPRVNQAPRSKAQPPKETSKPRQKSKHDAFRKGAMPMAPPLQGFYPWMKELEGNIMPSTGKVAPIGVTIAKAFAQRNPLASLRPKSWASTQLALPSPLSRHSVGALQKGFDAPAARSVRTAVSAVTPSDQTTPIRQWLRRTRNTAVRRVCQRPSNAGSGTRRRGCRHRRQQPTRRVPPSAASRPPVPPPQLAPRPGPVARTHPAKPLRVIAALSPAMAAPPPGLVLQAPGRAATGSGRCSAGFVAHRPRRRGAPPTLASRPGRHCRLVSHSPDRAATGSGRRSAGSGPLGRPPRTAEGRGRGPAAVLIASHTGFRRLARAAAGGSAPLASPARGRRERRGRKENN